MAQTIVVVEDDINTNEMITIFLKDKNYLVHSFGNGDEAYNFILNNKTIDLIIVDVMLPGMNGLDLLSNVRKSLDVPVVVLTALTDEQTQFVSFSKMADDFVEKPFSPLLLVKRVEAILRRTERKKITTTMIGAYTIDLDNLKIVDGVEEVSLTVKESEILYYLIANRGQIVTRKKLMESIWAYEYDVNDRSLDTHIKNLRKKMGSDSIVTYKGLGYKIEN